MLAAFALVLAVLVSVVLIGGGAGGGVCAGGVRAGAGGVGVDMFALLVGSGVVLMCSYSSVVALVVAVASVLAFALAPVVLALTRSFFLLVLGWC